MSNLFKTLFILFFAVQSAHFASATEIKSSFTKVEESALKGNAEAQLYLGLMYFNGEEIDQDYKEALHWFTESAKQGHMFAQFYVAMMYYWGDGTLQNYEQALYWYTEAAHQGDADAQYIVGLMYYKGEGTPQNLEEASKWLEKAVFQGNVEAQSVLEEVKQIIEEEDAKIQFAFNWMYFKHSRYPKVMEEMYYENMELFHR